MTKIPLVSICIPTYNSDKYIHETVSSLLNQCYDNIEIIISDDCSTDSTLQIINQYEDVRIKIYTSTKNQGIEKNWNKALQKCSGDYIKMIGADDVLENDCIEKQLKILQNDPSISLVSSYKNIINAKGKRILSIKFPWKTGKTNGIKAVRASIKKGTNIIGEPGIGMFPAKILQKTGLYNGQNPYLIDMDLWCRLLLHGDLFVIDEYLFNFRVSKSSISNSLGFKQYKYFIEFVHKLYESGDFKITKQELIQSYMYAFIKNIFRNIIFLMQ